MSDRGFREAAERYAEARGTAPRDQLERTAIGQEQFDRAFDEAYRRGGEPDMFFDDTPLSCGVENPESCESCQ